MKKFWIVLLALGLVAGFAMSASAADVKFSGSYYVAGIYADSVSLSKDQNNNAGAVPGPQAFYYQRLRVETTFKVAEGLNLVTRFDALERRWGDAAWRGTEDTYNRVSSTTQQIQENIEFERAYLDFTTKIGRFQVGYLNFVGWGTEFHDTNLTRAGIKWFIPIGPLTVIAAIEQGLDRNVGAQTYGNQGTQSDGDSHTYDLGVIYKFGAGDAGIIYQKGLNNNNRANGSATLQGIAANNSSQDLNIFIPYAKVKFGPAYVEGELIAGFGDLRKYEAPATTASVKAEQLALYLHAKADLGPAYVGGRFIYISGDDPKTTDKVEGSLMSALKSGDAFNPCLFMFNTEYTKWVSTIQTTPSLRGINPYTNTVGGMDTYLDNVWMYQIYGGFKPTPKIDLMASVTYAYADKKPYNTNFTGAAGSNSFFIPGQEFISDQYGTEIDLTAKYKIYDNLEYMVGGAYFITGDFFKGTDASFNKKDNYLLIHKLTLTF